MPHRLSSVPNRQRKGNRSDDYCDELKLADFRVGVDNVIFSVDTDLKRLLVLLVMRQEEPFLGQWSLPGTLVRMGLKSPRISDGASGLGSKVS